MPAPPPPLAPTFPGFEQFVTLMMGPPFSALPSGSPYLLWAYNVALEIVSLDIAACSGAMYTLAVYNLAADNLVNYAQDTPPSTAFAEFRKALDINTFVAGVVTSAGDQGTSDSVLNQDFFKGLTLRDLRNLKTPWGREYLSIAQDMGEVWGLS